MDKEAAKKLLSDKLKKKIKHPLQGVGVGTGVAAAVGLALVGRRAKIWNTERKILKSVSATDGLQSFLKSLRKGDVLLEDNLRNRKLVSLFTRPGKAVDSQVSKFLTGNFRHTSIYTGDGKLVEMLGPKGTTPKPSLVRDGRRYLALRFANSEKQGNRVAELASKAQKGGEYKFTRLSTYLPKAVGTRVINMVSPVKIRKVNPAAVNCTTFAADILGKAGVKLKTLAPSTSPYDLLRQGRPVKLLSPTV